PVRAAAARDLPAGAARVGVVVVELPRDQALDAPDEVVGDRVGVRPGEGPQGEHADGPGVPAGRVGPLDGPLDATGTPLPDPAARVHDEVVGDVPVAPVLDVELVDRVDGRGGLPAAVVLEAPGRP